jgi:hypothetical protein
MHAPLHAVIRFGKKVEERAARRRGRRGAGNR